MLTQRQTQSIGGRTEKRHAILSISLRSLQAHKKEKLFTCAQIKKKEKEMTITALHLGADRGKKKLKEHTDSG